MQNDKNFEPTLEGIEDYDGKESKEKRRMVRIVVASILIVGAIYVIIASNIKSAESPIADKNETGIYKY